MIRGSPHRSWNGSRRKVLGVLLPVLSVIDLLFLASQQSLIEIQVRVLESPITSTVQFCSIPTVPNPSFLIVNVLVCCEWCDRLLVGCVVN